MALVSGDDAAIQADTYKLLGYVFYFHLIYLLLLIQNYIYIYFLIAVIQVMEE